MTTPRKPRGPYRKGVRRREQILDTALEVFAGRGDAPLQEIADRVGLSQAGVLHYFGSREELLLAVLRRRDTLDRAAGEHAGGPGEAVARTVRHNMDQPGLVRLFVSLSAAATDPSHPAHEFFADRYRDLTATIARGLAAGRRAGTVRADEDAEHLARLLVAVSDGLQLQWLLDPSVDMAALVETFDRLCAAPREE
ncbi:TetR/AcrR family transcriptional regulator [Actinomadura algeriensis]|uniref:AcrR family transcriptional regulator n=1 Tax=Actinomadura algeriensis TaxID=1679523 RepID=A0ABR9JJI4_9ACTN|nr:TetR/AcrR family transcriptional regulator [Actinomadura algeriensis]MBE1530683.1 AcrR family transcriptional regulator [Actinomadura algeriensis]